MYTVDDPNSSLADIMQLCGEDDFKLFKISSCKWHGLTATGSLPIHFTTMESPPKTTKLLEKPRKKKPVLISGGRAPLNPANLGGSHGGNQLYKNERSTAILAGWILLLVGYLIAAIPMLGFLIYAVGFLFCIPAGILGIMGASKGRPIGGVFLIIASISSFFLYLAMPFFVIGIIGWIQK